MQNILHTWLKHGQGSSFVLPWHPTSPTLPYKHVLSLNLRPKPHVLLHSPNSLQSDHLALNCTWKGWWRRWNRLNWVKRKDWIWMNECLNYIESQLCRSDQIHVKYIFTYYRLNKVRNWFNVCTPWCLDCFFFQKRIPKAIKLDVRFLHFIISTNLCLKWLKNINYRPYCSTYNGIGLFPRTFDIGVFEKNGLP